MDDDEVAELAHLRRRAYGPDADIAADAAAIARLDELETLARRRFAAVPDAVGPERPAAAAGRAAATERAAAGAGGDVASAASAPTIAIPARPPAGDPSDPTTTALSEDGAPVARSTRRPPTERRLSDSGVFIEDADTAGGMPGVKPRRRRTALVAAAAVGAVVLAAQFADRMGNPSAEPLPSPSSAPYLLPATVPASNSLETRLVDIPLDRSLARYVRQTPPPAFPVAGGLSWVETLGPYYGWNLWLARSSAGDQRCILVERGDKAYAQCLPEEGFLVGELEVSVPFGDVAPEYRPARMTGGESLVYRWTADRGVAIVLDPGGITYFGDDD